MQRFFVTFPLGIDIELTDKSIVDQITKVLRMKEGESVILFDGDGSETEYEIQRIEKKSIRLRGKGRTFPRTEPQTRVVIYQALPNKYEKIEYIIQKGIEVGVWKFVFFRSDRSQKLLLSPAKIERFHTIAREALEQCGGVRMPEIEFIEGSSFISLFQAGPRVQDSCHRDEGSDLVSKIETRLLCSSQGQNQNKEVTIVLDTIGSQRRISEFRDPQHIGLWIGPEGGWSEGERTKMNDYGFIFAHFSERVFRTETTGVVAAFALINQ